MADVEVSVRENTGFPLTLVWKDRRNEEDPFGVVDITGYAFELVVGFNTVNDDGFLVFTEAFKLTGSIVTAADGTYKFTFTPKETALAPGIYIGEINAWSSGTVTEPPTDSLSFQLTVVERLDQP